MQVKIIERHKKLRFIATYLLLVSALVSLKAANAGDSISYSHPTPRISYWREFSYVPVPLIASAFIVKACKNDIRGARNNFIPGYKSELDNYIQYAPIVLATGLKAVGVESRSKWGRYAVSSAFSYAVMAGIVNLAKYTIKEERPDGSSRNSFPSGHTATAFASASILHKEFGQTRSLWHSVAGYSVATITGVMRVMNNRHWASDVLCGAGIGIFSVDLGYFLGDIIFRDKQLQRPIHDNECNFLASPNFFNLSVGAGLIEHSADIAGLDVNINRMITAQAEAAYFFTKHLGAGIRFNVGSPIVSYDKYSDVMGIYTLTAGAYLQYPITPRFAIGGKAMIGRLLISGFKLGEELSVDKKVGTTYGIGANIGYAYRNNIAWSLNADFDMNHVRFKSHRNNQDYSQRKAFGQLTLSASMSVMF